MEIENKQTTMAYQYRSTLMMLLFVASLITLPSALSLNTHRMIQNDDANNNNCGQIIGTMRMDEVRWVGRSFLSQFITNDTDLVQRSTDVIFQPVLRNLNIVKLCASCQDHADWYYERNSLVFPGYHSIYCNENDPITYGARLSAFALIPNYNDDNGDNTTTHGLPPNFKLRTFLTMPPTQINDDGTIVSSTENFLSLWTSGKSNNYTFPIGTSFFSTYLPGMMAASAGAIALFPDYLSSNTNVIRRSIFRQRSYEHATAVSYLALERYVMDTSQKCTLLDKAVTIYGNDVDSAFGASVATLVLQRFGVACLSTFLSTGLLDLPLMLQDAIRDTYLAADTTASMNPAAINSRRWLQLAAHTIASMDRQFDNGVSWISDKYSDALRQTFVPDESSTGSTNTTGTISILSLSNLPWNVSDLFHPMVVEALRNYNSAEWDVNETDSTCNRFDSMNTTTGTVTTNNSTLYEQIICQLRAKYSVYNILMSDTDRPWISNISACYSNMDEIVNGTHQYEYGGLLQNVKFVEKYWSRYTQPIGFDLLNITNQDHTAAVQLCTVAPLLFLSLDGHRPGNNDERGNYAPPMTSEETMQCQAVTAGAGTSPVTPDDGNDGSIPVMTPVNPTIVAQPTTPDDSNPTIVSDPSSSVTQPTDATPTKDIVIDGTPTSSNDNEKESDSSTSGAPSTSKQDPLFYVMTLLMIAIIATLM